MIYHCYGLTITAGSRAFSIAGFEIGNGSIELSLLFFEPVVLAKKKKYMAAVVRRSCRSTWWEDGR